jgi:hypothetical protein
MKIKIIKKGTKNNEAADFSLSENVIKPPKKVEKKVETNILGWVSELREKKRFEFIQAQNLFGN